MPMEAEPSKAEHNVESSDRFYPLRSLLGTTALFRYFLHSFLDFFLDAFQYAVCMYSETLVNSIATCLFRYRRRLSLGPMFFRSKASEHDYATIRVCDEVLRSLFHLLFCQVRVSLEGLIVFSIDLQDFYVYLWNQFWFQHVLNTCMLRDAEVIFHFVRVTF